MRYFPWRWLFGRGSDLPGSTKRVEGLAPGGVRPTFAPQTGNRIVVNGAGEVRIGQVLCEFCPWARPVWTRGGDTLVEVSGLTARLLAQHVEICHAGTVADTQAAQARLLGLKGLRFSEGQSTPGAAGTP